MAGIYIHVPYCKKACNYCNFHFSTRLQSMDSYVDALCKEMELRSDFFEPKTLIQTLYFGGGTPSLLKVEDVKKIISTLKETFELRLQECTLEINPHDISIDMLNRWREIGVDRLSIGVQALDDATLQALSREHSAREAINCIEMAHKAGIKHTSIDIIYGIPQQSEKSFVEGLNIISNLPIDHLSTYALTIEPNTLWDAKVGSAAYPPISQTKQNRDLSLLQQWAANHQWERYEVSSWAKAENYALHNTNYWCHKPYLGLGPSAHSYDGKYTRTWNIANNAIYIQSLQNGKTKQQSETLNQTDLANEIIMLGLRTRWGISRARLSELNSTLYETLCNKTKQYDQKKWLLIEEDSIRSSEEGWLFADKIASDLFF